MWWELLGSGLIDASSLSQEGGFSLVGLTFRPMTPRQAMEGIAVAMAGYRCGRGFGGGPARQT